MSHYLVSFITNFTIISGALSFLIDDVQLLFRRSGHLLVSVDANIITIFLTSSCGFTGIPLIIT